MTEFSQPINQFANPKWFNDSREQLRRTFTLELTINMGFSTYLGAKRLTPEDYANLQNALENPKYPQLYEEILANAMDALEQEQHRRAVLEMAIACEVLVKQAYFNEGRLGSAAFEHFAKRASGNDILDLINKVALEAIATGFNDVAGGHFTNIENLFNCRNKVAHQGKLEYKGKVEKKIVEAKRDTIIEWWKSVNKLVVWVESVLLPKGKS